MQIENETERLIIKQFALCDAEFIVQLLNDESFKQYIGDKNVRSKEDAETYLLNGPLLSYEVHGFGLKLVQLKDSKIPIGMCGILKRDALPLPDLGFAFLPEFTGKGYAREAANCILKEAAKHGPHHLLAITLPENIRSNQLLLALGFTPKRQLNLNDAQNNVYEYVG